MCLLRAGTKKWPHLGLDGPDRKSVDPFPTCDVQTPTSRWLTPLGRARTHRRKRFLPNRCPFSPILGEFGLRASTEKGFKMVQDGSKGTFAENGTVPFGVSLEVFLARSEAPVRRFDLRRVVRFTYPQCAFQTMSACQKEVNGVRRCCTKRREIHPLQPGPNSQS